MATSSTAFLIRSKTRQENHPKHIADDNVLQCTVYNCLYGTVSIVELFLTIHSFDFFPSPLHLCQEYSFKHTDIFIDCTADKKGLWSE